MQDQMLSKPFQFERKNKNFRSMHSRKYQLRQSLQKAKNKRRLKITVRRRRINQQKAIRVKKNGCNWWDKFMKIYYNPVTEQDIVNCQINTTSDVMLTFEEIKSTPNSYLEMFLFREHPQYLQCGAVPVLFRSNFSESQTQESSDQIEDHCEIVVYKYEPKSIPSKIIQQEYNYRNKCIPIIRIESLNETIQGENNATLQYLGSITDAQTVFDCLFYQESLIKHDYNYSQCQLAHLSKKLEEIHQQNMKLWDRAIYNHQLEMQSFEKLQENCSGTNELLTKIACRERLLYFKKGFSDKTEDELEEALYQMQISEQRLTYSRDKKKRLASYNDCKICFNLEVKSNNNIIFCSVCLTSYHNHCYGLTSPDQDKNYICDACLWMEEQGLQFEDEENRPQCAICFSKKEFPLKRVNGKFYHITCIFFFGFANVKSFEIQLKSDLITSKNNNQDVEQRCEYCLPSSYNSGLKLQCSQSRCTKQFHPICAYLRGCIFEITRPDELQIRIRCQYHSYHSNEDDQIRQVYLRRFFCNYENIQKLTEEGFKPLYRDEKMAIVTANRRLRDGDVTWQQYEALNKKVKVNNFDHEYYASLSLEQLMGDLDMNQKQESEKEQSDEVVMVQQSLYDCDKDEWEYIPIND